MNYLAISAEWSKDLNTFKIIPLNKECLFIECIYSVENKCLVVVSKETYDKIVEVPKIDDNGELVKASKTRASGNQYKGERRIMSSYNEYIISNMDEIKIFIGNIGVVNKEIVDKYLEIQ